MMKKILVLLIITFTINSVYADWSTNWLHNCFVSKKYYSHAKVKHSTWSTANDKGCTWAQSQVSSYSINQTYDAYAWAKRDGSGSNGGGYHQNGWNHGNGIDPNPSIFSFAPNISINLDEIVAGENFGSTQMSDEDIIENISEHSLIINNLTGNIQVKTNDLANDYSTIQIRVFTFEVKNEGTDEEYLEPKDIVWYAKATIINGKLFLEGQFTEDEFIDESTSDNQRKYSLIKHNKIINLPSNVSFENICVEMSGDGGSFAQGVENRFAPNLNNKAGTEIIDEIKSEAIINFEINPTLSISQLNIQITKNEPDAKVTELVILSIDGKVMNQIPINSNKSQISTDISSLSKGVYFAKLKIGDKYYGRKFIKE